MMNPIRVKPDGTVCSTSEAASLQMVSFQLASRSYGSKRNGCLATIRAAAIFCASAGDAIRKVSALVMVFLDSAVPPELLLVEGEPLARQTIRPLRRECLLKVAGSRANSNKFICMSPEASQFSDRLGDVGGGHA